MMKNIVVLLISFLCLNVQAQDLDWNKNIQSKISNGKFLEAFQVLQEKDPNNKDVDVFLAKVHLAMNFYVVQNQFEQFGFVNLEKSQQLEDVRKSSGKYLLHSLKIAPIIDSFLLHMPDEPALHRAQADYLYECLLNYKSDFYLSQEALLEKLEKSVHKTIELGAADYETFFVMGYLQLNKKNYAEAQRYFKQSVRMNQQYAPVFYNLSYVEFALKNFDQAIMHGKTAMNLYTQPTQQSDAARMISYAYDFQMMTDSAIYYLEKAIELDPQNVDAIVDYLYIAIREKLPNQEELILAAIMIHPTHPEVYNGVLNAYFEEGDNYAPVLKVLDFLEMNYSKEDMILCNVFFYKGQILYEGAPQEAIENFIKARNIFQKIYPPHHEVFQVISQYLENAPH